jgi:hypothetical protein
MLSPGLPVLSAEKLAALKGSTAAKQKFAATAKDVRTVISTRDSPFPVNRIMVLLYPSCQNYTSLRVASSKILPKRQRKKTAEPIIFR